MPESSTSQVSTIRGSLRYFYDYPGMSVGNRVEVDPLSIFFGPDKFRLSGFIPTLLFWLLAVNWLRIKLHDRK